MEREPSATPPNDSGALGGDDDGVAFASAYELRPSGEQNQCQHGRLMHEAHGTGERMHQPLVLHCCVVAGEQAGLTAGSVASDAGGEEVRNHRPKLRPSGEMARGCERSTGRYGVSPLEWVVPHAVGARERHFPPSKQTVIDRCSQIW